MGKSQETWRAYRILLAGYQVTQPVDASRLVSILGVLAILGKAATDFVCTFMTISRWIIVRMKISSGESCREILNLHFMLNFFFLEIAPFMWLCGTIWRSRTCHRWQCGTCTSYGYKITLRICNNHCFSSLPRLDEGAAILIFTYTVFIVSYSSYMTGKYIKYLLMESEWRIVTCVSIFFWSRYSLWSLF